MPGRLVLACGLLLGALAVAARSRRELRPDRLHDPHGRRPATAAVPHAGSVEMVSLDQLATFFGLTLVEDALVGGLTVRGKGQTILLIPGSRSRRSVPGDVVSLSGPVQRERNAWQVPRRLHPRRLAPALGFASRCGGRRA